MPDLWLSAVFCQIKKITPPYCPSVLLPSRLFISFFSLPSLFYSVLLPSPSVLLVKKYCIGRQAQRLFVFLFVRSGNPAGFPYGRCDVAASCTMYITSTTVALQFLRLTLGRMVSGSGLYIRNVPVQCAGQWPVTLEAV